MPGQGPAWLANAQAPSVRSLDDPPSSEIPPPLPLRALPADMPGLECTSGKAPGLLPTRKASQPAATGWLRRDSYDLVRSARVRRKRPPDAAACRLENVGASRQRWPERG